MVKENEITFGYLNSIPERAAIKERLTELWDYEKYNRPSLYVDRFFFTKNDGLQNQDVLYMMRGINGTPKMILDPTRCRGSSGRPAPRSSRGRDWTACSR